MKKHAKPIRILVVEDDEFVRQLLCAILEGAQFEAVGAASIEALHERRTAERFDVILLDLGLPDGDGLDALSQIRSEGVGVPVVVLTRRTDVDARVEALELGADDYVIKPVDPRELLLRIQRLVDFVGEAPTVEASERIELGEWAVDIGQRTVVHASRGQVTLTRSEFDLLVAMASQPNRVLTREQLLDALDRGDGGPYDRTVDVLVSRLRKKMADASDRLQLIQTVQGVGYKLVPEG